MKAPGFSIGRQRQRAIRVVVPALIVWIMGGLLLTLQPCCEVLAASAGPVDLAAQGRSAHSSPGAQHAAPHEHGERAAHAHGGGGAPHSHCKPADNPLEGAPVAAAAAPGGAPDALKAPSVSTDHVAMRLVGFNGFAISRLQHPPSFRLHYLRTQRFRI